MLPHKLDLLVPLDYVLVDIYQVVLQQAERGTSPDEWYRKHSLVWQLVQQGTL